MRSPRGKLPSPALIVAAVALTLAMVGTSIAQDPAAKITKAKVKSIAKKQINKAAPKLSVAKAVDADKAKSAETATTATNATNAANAATVDNMSVKKFSAKQPANTALATIATVGTLQIQTGCSAGGDPLLNVAPAAGAASQAVRTSVILTGANLTIGDGTSTLGGGGFEVVSDGDGNVDGSVEAVTTTGQVTTVQFGARNVGNFNPVENVCVVYGTAVAG